VRGRKSLQTPSQRRFGLLETVAQVYTECHAFIL
jgi:hypothetical protein